MGIDDKREKKKNMMLTLDLFTYCNIHCTQLFIANKDHLKDGEPSPFPVFSLKRDLRKPVFLLPSDKEN